MRSKKEPECGDRIVHGSGNGVESELSALHDDIDKKKPRLQYRSFMSGRRCAPGANTISDQPQMPDKEEETREKAARSVYAQESRVALLLY